MNIENAFGKLIGGGLLAGATLAVCFWPEAEREKPPADPVRPIKSVVVAPAVALSDVHFAATVKAANRRVLAFKQSGRILRIPVENGKAFKKGDRLAWLDPHDLENDLKIAEAAAERSRLSFERKQAAAKTGGVSRQEVADAEAVHKSNEAQLALKKRALEDSVLIAPFDGIVAKCIADELEVVNGSNPREVMIIQDTEKIKVDAVVPETVAIVANAVRWKAGSDKHTVNVTFDAMPDRHYSAKFSEFETTSERNAAQTYIATFEMENPKDLKIMPGMSATVTIPGDSYGMDEKLVKNPLVVPESAVGVASDGHNFVWVLEKSEREGLYVARRRDVELDCAGFTMPIVKSGLKSGERVAAAGVSVLTEGRTVSLIEE